MLLYKYTDQSAGSNSDRPSCMKGPRSPPREKSPRYTRPYEPWALGPWMAPPPYAPYYFNGRWEQPPMALNAFHPKWTAPRRSVRDRISQPVRDRLGNGADRSLQKSSNKGLQKEWRPKSPSDRTLESNKQEQNVNTNIVVIGTQVIKS